MVRQELIDRVRNLHAMKRGGRIIIGIAGSPGSGKSTLAHNLVSDINSGANMPAVHVPMDGFHLSNSTLDRLGFRSSKGALHTFDGWGFIGLLHRVTNETGHVVYAPSFHREVDEGVAGDIAVEPSHTIIVVEGNYLLVDQEPWKKAKPLLTESWFCHTPDDERFSRLVERHTLFGKTPDAAREWVTNVDNRNAEVIENTRRFADVVVSGIDGSILA